VDYLGNGRDYSVKALRDAGIDFVIGSVHYIGYFADGRGFCFDGQPADFFRGVEELYGNDFRPVISGYFERVRQMMDIDRPDVVGHFDKIKMHTTVRPYINEDDPLYWKEVEESLDLMAETGCILEVNTRGLYKHNPPLLYPSAGILESAFRRDIPVMMNSDSHHPDEIDSGFADTAALLRQIGYRSVRVLLNGNWQDRGFTPAGIEV
jgi:histidinol-phosphatase (PHP family)